MNGAHRMLFVFIVTLIMLPLTAHADDAPQWKMVFNNFNQGNSFAVGDAISGKFAIAFGGEKDPSGGSSKVVLRKSTDGGASWMDITIPTYGAALYTYFTDIKMFTKDFGYLVGLQVAMTGNTAGPIWRIKDNGDTLQPLIVRPKQFPDCRYISCLDQNTCWASCEKGEIIRTTNGGQKWESGYLPVTDLNPGPISFVNANEGWCAMFLLETKEETGSGGETQTVKIIHDRATTFKTTDGGKNWTKLTENEHYTFSHMQMIDNQVGYLVAKDDDKAYLLKTSNGGQQWFIQPIPATQTVAGQKVNLIELGGIHFFDANHGWTVASYGDMASESGALNKLIFYYTEDGGANWAPNKATQANGKEVAGRIYSMSFINENLGYAFGEMQLVIRFGTESTPTDGDVDGDSGPDGDNEGSSPDGDEDTDTGPVYTGAPGEPCPKIGDATTYGLPRCDSEKGAPLCAWHDAEEAHCTLECSVTDDPVCRTVSTLACCKPVSFEGKTKNICLIDPYDCPSSVYSTQKWHGYQGALLGEECYSKDNPDFPRCDATYGGRAYQDERIGTFCTKLCDSVTECETPFQTSPCCLELISGQPICLYSDQCNVLDGDTEPTDGDSVPVDGDDVEGEETPTVCNVPEDCPANHICNIENLCEACPSGTLRVENNTCVLPPQEDGDEAVAEDGGNGGGSGCGSVNSGTAWLVLLLVAAMAIRRRETA